MAVYKLFPEKDATLYSEYPVINSGIDEILEATTATSLAGQQTTSRFLVQFNQNQIQDIFSSKITGSYDAYLRVFMAKVEGLAQDTLVYCYPVSGAWSNGTGKYLDSPAVTDGVSWAFRTASGSGAWDTIFSEGNATGSWSGTNTGGGNWYTEASYAQSASMQYRSTFDLNLEVTNVVNAWSSSIIENNGFIIKQEDAAEFNSTRNVEFKYFSTDTNTIYPPQLEFRWDDYTFNTGSSTQTIINSSNIVATLPNNPGTYQAGAVQRFRINCRPQYPARVFTTSSLYTTNYYLPTSSYWAIKDLDTDEFVIDFDTVYTKVSADSNSNYFDVYMNGLEPERYYKILIKTTIDNSIKILDDEYYFKIVNG